MPTLCLSHQIAFLQIESLKLPDKSRAGKRRRYSCRAKLSSGKSNR
jgi:hypothetical protein